MVVYVKVGDLVCRLATHYLVDVTQCAAIYLLLVRDVPCVSRQVFLVEGRLVGEQAASIGR